MPTARGKLPTVAFIVRAERRDHANDGETTVGKYPLKMQSSVRPIARRIERSGWANYCDLGPFDQSAGRNCLKSAVIMAMSLNGRRYLVIYNRRVLCAISFWLDATNPANSKFFRLCVEQ